MIETIDHASDAVRLRLMLQHIEGNSMNEQAEAWLIPGGDAATWIAELCNWEIPLDEVMLLVLPASASSGSKPAGVLAIPPNSGGRSSPKVSPLAQPYVRLARNLFRPAGARFRPPVSETELQSWPVWDAQVMHPTIGLVGCHEAQLLRVADLLEAPMRTSVDWSMAQPGIVVEAHVRSVKPIAPLEISQFLRESSDDIAGAAPESLPPLPEESAIRKAGAIGMMGALGALAWLAQLVSGKKATRTGTTSGTESAGWSASLYRWATAKGQSLRSGMEEARLRELARLMRMLESSPDTGLRFALPLTDKRSRRGIAPPANRLSQRATDFNLSRLFSAPRADPWAIPQDVQERLRAKYRELANREMALGRFRRSAYIFAELLGDFASAAAILQRGRFFREAAALYRDRLNNTLAAAQCLESGGLLDEAIEAYLPLKMFEKIGDLHRRLGREEEAAAAYRAAIAEHRARGDTLAAARLLESKLDAADEAYAMLRDEWPRGPRARTCLAESFNLLGRTKKHEDAARLLTSLSRDAIENTYALDLAHVLAGVATDYPNQTVRNTAADAVRVVAGRRLAVKGAERVSTDAARSLAHAISRTMLDDRLLARDAERYVARLIAEQPKPPRPRSRSVNTPAGKITMLHAFSVGGDVAWQSAVARGGSLYLGGATSERLVIARATWDGQIQKSLFGGPAHVNHAFQLEVADSHSSGRNRVITREILLIPHRVDLQSWRLAPTIVPPTGSFYDEMRIRTPAVLPPQIYDACLDDANRLWVVHAVPDSSNLVISGFDGFKSFARTTRTTWPVPDEESASTIKLASRGGYTCVTSGDSMQVIQDGDPAAKSTFQLQLSRPVVAMSASAPHTRPRLVVVLAEGACIVWPAEKRMASFAAEVFDLVVGLTGDGLLIAAGRQRVAAYRVDRGVPELIATAEPRGPLPVKILPAPGDRTFAVLYADGLVQIMKCA